MRVEGSGFRVEGSGFRVQGSGFRVDGSRLKVQGGWDGVAGHAQRRMDGVLGARTTRQGVLEAGGSVQDSRHGRRANMARIR